METTKYLNIAHRGARSLAPENTLLAGRKAFALGASGWELDVAMTADGELVLLHDNTLERTTNAAEIFTDRRPWKIEDFTLAEIEQLDAGSWFLRQDPFNQIAAGAISPEDQEAILGARIPTLEEALEYTRAHQWFVNIEIKDATGTPADGKIVRAVVETIQDLGMSGLVLISSFNHNYLRRVKSLIPALATGVLVESFVQDPIALLKDLNAQAYHPSKDAITEDQVLALHKEEFAVYVWTVNEESEMRELMEMGVNGIITDYPQMLKDLIKSDAPL